MSMQSKTQTFCIRSDRVQLPTTRTVTPLGRIVLTTPCSVTGGHCFIVRATAEASYARTSHCSRHAGLDG